MKTERRSGKQSKFFRGEMMVCAICGTSKVSNPAVSSNWNLFEIEGVAPFYVCPKCFKNWIEPKTAKRS